MGLEPLGDAWPMELLTAEVAAGLRWAMVAGCRAYAVRPDGRSRLFYDSAVVYE